MTKRGQDLGRAFENRVARLFGGIRFPGTDGDVSARGYIIECKYHEGLARLPLLRGWLDQVNRYEKRHPGTIFPLAITGGKKYQNGRTWIVIDARHFKDLTDPASDGKLLEELTRIREMLERREHGT